ncbi:hypothetical protein PIB30_076959 [Stylosanthes scabra]|uniref:Uncharacterized protein n=1 Tax=Stylosanthes scabra TaxID=79078 RepID=A0ABU6ZP19_9FABA|nr:hypothetical protein [Stylosanthes scabra]
MEFEVLVKELDGEIFNVKVHPYRSSNQDSPRKGSSSVNGSETSIKIISNSNMVVEEPRLEAEENKTAVGDDSLINEKVTNELGCENELSAGGESAIAKG